MNNECTSAQEGYTRREFGKLLGLSGLTLVLGCNTSPKPSSANSSTTEVPFNDFSTEPIRNFESPFKPIHEERAAAKGSNLLGNFNPVYMEKLIQSLKSSLLRPDQKAQAIGSRLGWVIAQGEGSALKIDEGGYYLTVTHNFLANSEIKRPTLSDLYKGRGDVYDPNTGSLRPITNFVVHPDFFKDGKNDIALFYAPTGESMQASEGICLDTDFPQDGTELWMHALFVEVRKNILRSFRYGIVNSDLIDVEGYSFDEFIKVKGIIPFGGSSGAPIYDSFGNIRGVEAGAIKNSKVNDYQNYNGAALAPVRGIDGLLDEIKKGNIHRLLIE